MNKVTEFCLKCGTSFPPREGEGRCVDWFVCEDKQLRGKVLPYQPPAPSPSGAILEPSGGK